MKAIKKVLGCLRKADNDFNLISDGDKICVGISGGKDSSVLLYCLYLYQKFSKKNYEILGIFIDSGFEEERIDELIEYFDKLGLKIIKYPSQILEILKLNLDKDGSLQCSLCSKLRRGAIFNAAKEYGCNKVAFGHHSDDAVETLFMNMIHGGRISTFKPDTFMERVNIHLIRPMVYAYESDIIRVCNDLEIPIAVSKCPNNGYTERQAIKEMLGEMYHKFGCKDNFQLMLRNQAQLEIFKPIVHMEEDTNE